MKEVLLAVMLSIGLAATGYAQEPVLSVPFDSARFMWDVAAGYAERFGPTAHVITCGEYTKRVEMPATSVPVQEVVPSTGSYQCSIYGVNSWGKSAEPDPQFPLFDAGLRPPAPVELRLEVR